MAIANKVNNTYQDLSHRCPSWLSLWNRAFYVGLCKQRNHVLHILNIDGDGGSSCPAANTSIGAQHQNDVSLLNFIV